MSPPPPPPLEPEITAGGAVALPDPGLAIPSALEQLLAKGWLRATLAMLGPAFVASIAYVDPGQLRHQHRRRRTVRLPAVVGGAAART